MLSALSLGMNIKRMSLHVAVILASCVTGLGTAACGTSQGVTNVAPDAPAFVLADAAPRDEARPHHAALAFTLNESTRACVIGWAANNDVSCEQRSAGRWMHCVNVPSDAVGQPNAPSIDELDLRFDGSGKLWNVQAKRQNAAPASAARYFAQITHELDERIGAPSEAVGDASPAPRERSARTYRATGMRAKLVASNFGPGGVLLLASYSSRT